VTDEALKRHGIDPDLTPEQPKLGPLVAKLANLATQLQKKKRGPRV
jgi:hypothetical protein